MALAAIFSLEGLSLAWIISYLFFAMYTIVITLLIRLYTHKVFGIKLRYALTSKILISLLAVFIGVVFTSPFKFSLDQENLGRMLYYGNLLHVPGLEFIIFSMKFSLLPALIIYGRLLRANKGSLVGLKRAASVSLVEPVSAFIFFYLFENVSPLLV
jgi:hypothetical protein